MASPTVENGMQVEVQWTLQSQQCENRIFVRSAAAPTPTDLSAVADVVANWVDATYAPLLSEFVGFTNIVVTDRHIDGGPQHVLPIGSAGSDTGAVLPNEVSFCVKLTTGFTGRSRRGRWYMPPPTATQLLNSNTVNSTYADAAAAVLQALIDDLFAADYRAGVVSFIHDGAPVASPVVLAYTVATYADRILDSMRSRRPGIGL